ncbi:hypothetical protein [Nocardiopsis composta]|uniref:Uncharacterized protein n=1 Tax=Nocardiopsis composta TaxID=157465 RepID=A0A7W8QNV4_9ACTN|nr:hypothetical protein [Nocardiopsis composta]MBB5433424.1 hypothetical protein [Nocardiopsis composta]
MEAPGQGGSAPADEAAQRRRLRTLWCRRSRLTGWDPPDDWWTPVVDHICEAAVRGGDLVPGCLRFGQARARSGVDIGATITDFAALTDVLGWPEPPLPLVRALAEGWVDGGRSTEECQDPLTGLATVAFLRTRIGELYRGGAQAGEHRLVIVALDPTADPWRRTAQLIVLGHELNRYFVRAESIALLSRTRLAVLTEASADLAERARHLRENICREHGAELWTVPLPDRPEEARALLNDIGRPLST